MNWYFQKVNLNIRKFYSIYKFLGSVLRTNVLVKPSSGLQQQSTYDVNVRCLQRRDLLTFLIINRTNMDIVSIAQTTGITLETIYKYYLAAKDISDLKLPSI